MTDYTTDGKGRITSPGKFEGETLFSVALYDSVMNGFGGDDSFYMNGHEVDVFKAPFNITADLSPVVNMPDYSEPYVEYAAAWEDDNGFWYVSVFETEAVYQTWREANEDPQGEVCAACGEQFEADSAVTYQQGRPNGALCPNCKGKA